MTISSLWFYFAPCGHGLINNTSGIIGCFYFSLVTFTSLGYGDVLPIGFGRSVALLDVISGLILTAVFIGKFASERQSSILLLLHTSDTQRRIAEFSKELVSIRASVELATESKDLSRLNDLLDKHIGLDKAVKNYLMFNSHQAGVVEFGNFTALIGLYDEIKISFDTMYELHQNAASFGDVMLMRRTYTNMNFMHQIVSRMRVIHDKRKEREPLWQLALRKVRMRKPASPSTAEQSAINRLDKLSALMGTRMDCAKNWINSGYHPLQVAKVLKAFPVGPKSTWQVGVHKVVATNLGISNTVAAHCITELLNDRRLPKLK